MESVTLKHIYIHRNVKILNKINTHAYTETLLENMYTCVYTHICVCTPR